MKPNTNPETGIRYGIIAANNLDPEIIDTLRSVGKDILWDQAQKDLRRILEEEADDLEEEVKIGIAELDPGLVGKEDFEESRILDAYGAKGYSCREDFIDTEMDRRSQHIEIDEPIHEGEYEGVKFRTTWLGGALMVWIFQSPYLTRARLCSPCVPNCGDLDNLDPDGEECYDVPPDWRGKE